MIFSNIDAGAMSSLLHKLAAGQGETPSSPSLLSRVAGLLLAAVLLLPGGTSAEEFRWTWIKGTNTTNQFGIYGTLGVADAANRPGARERAVSWTGSDGALWLSGGWGYPLSGATGRLNDLWRFDPASGNWTWIKGTSTINQLGIYGTLGVADAANTPGSRDRAGAWTGSDEALWLFGGIGFGASGGSGYLNDVWRFDPVSGDWTWAKGAGAINQFGTYGIIGVADAANTPGAREGVVSWTGSDGTLWLFGGLGYPASGATGHLSDLWRFDPASGDWTWVKGTSTINQHGIYGTLGVADAANRPGGRYDSVSWMGTDGTLWLSGGFGYAASGGIGYLNDLWRFDPATEEWTWIKGASIINQFGIYGTPGVADGANRPGGRSEAVSWTGSDGTLWLSGGWGYPVSGTTGRLNDLWRFDPASGDWTWVKGTSTINQLGIYGTIGMADGANAPGSRDRAMAWTGSDQALWLSGGFGFASSGMPNYLSDLWRGTLIYTLAYDAGPNGSIDGPTPQTVEHGQDGEEVTAIPDLGYSFVDWSDGGTDNPRTDTNVTSDLGVTANFAVSQYTLTYEAGPNGSIDGTTPQTVEHGDDGDTVTAVPDGGYLFVDWSDGSTDNPRTDTNITGNILVTANFTEAPPMSVQNWLLLE